MINDFPEGYKLISNFITGSQLYGTNTKNSDIDERGVFIANKEIYLGFLNNVNQIQRKYDDIDIEYHELKTFMKLALDNNPNLVEFLFIPESKMLYCTKEWERIIENREHFISKKAKYTFAGYAFQQLKRIKNHRRWLLDPPKKKPEREDFGLPKERSLIPEEQIGAFNSLLSVYLEEIREFHNLKDQILEMNETHNFRTICQNLKDADYKAIETIIPVSENFLMSLQKEKSYMQMKKEWECYQNWKENRNKDRAILEKKYCFDTKHGMNLIRLMFECEELLTTGKITFPRPEAEFLLSVKNGSLTYDQLMEIVDNYDKKFEDLYEKSTLPKSPNRVKVNELCIELIEESIF